MAKTLTELSDLDLLAALSEAKEELFNLRFQNVTGQLDSHGRITVVRRDVARAMTELRAREIAAAEAQEAPALEEDNA